MAPEELHNFFSTLGLGAKAIGGIHDNFGVGAKIASLPWNPDGVVVISYKNRQASMIKIVLDPESNEYELVDFDTGDGRTSVIDPSAVAWEDDIDWSAVAPDWAREHGTTIVLLGSDEFPDTITGNARAEERDIKGLSVYLNTRFWDLSAVDVKVAELRSDKKNSWPLNRDDKENTRRPNNRKILGAKYYVTEVESSAGGRPAAHGSLLLDDSRVRAEWYLWEGERPYIHMYAKKQGYIAVRYRDELFEVSSLKPSFRSFGVVESKVQQNLTVILEPQHFDSKNGAWGVHPDQSRNRLIFSGSGEKGVGLPMSDWGLEFAENLPQEIRDAIRAARGDIEGSIEDEEYRKRLQDKFGARWTVKRLVSVPRTESPEQQIEAQETSETLKAPKPAVPPARPRAARRRSKTLLHVRLRANAGPGGQAVEMDVPVDVPRYRYASPDDFQEPWHAAMWSPHDEKGPTVILNTDAPTILEAVKYHQDQYPDVHAEEIQKTVRDVYGEVAVAKIAHSQQLVSRISEQDLDRDYRSEMALTLALMGLLAEDTLIAQRLGKLGRKKSAA